MWIVIGHPSHQEAASRESLEKAISLYKEAFGSFPWFWYSSVDGDRGHINNKGEWR